MPERQRQPELALNDLKIGVAQRGRGYAHQHIAFPEAAPVQQLLDAHPAGATIRVYHDPEAPAVSVLTTQRPTTDGMWFPWLPGLGGVLALVVAFRSSRSTQPGGPRRWNAT